MTFDLEDVCAWVAGRLDEPEKRLAIEEDLAKGEAGFVAPLLTRLARSASELEKLLESEPDEPASGHAPSSGGTRFRLRPPGIMSTSTFRSIRRTSLDRVRARSR